MLLPARLLHRKPDANKGDFGHIFILAGSAGYSGAALLCAEAAIRTGSGMVTLCIPESLNNAIIKIKPKEVITFPAAETKEATLSLLSYKKIKNFAEKIDILVIGPGLSLNHSTQGLARKIISSLDKPMVIDADGLNALAGNLSILRKRSQENRESILTPHPGEMARLLGASAKIIQDSRKETAKKFSLDFKVTVVLKGHNTVVADNKNNIYINRTGNPGMATAGSGDVLTGMIAALWGQGLTAFDAAKYAVYLHGLAGDLAAAEKTQISLIASDIIGKIPEAVKKSS